MHVSTLYTNCNRMDVDEKIYDHILNYNQLIPFANILKNISDEHDKQIVQDLLFQQLPNTYTLTKHFAEKFIYHESTSIPSGIFRPPIGQFCNAFDLVKIFRLINFYPLQM